MNDGIPMAAKFAVPVRSGSRTFGVRIRTALRFYVLVGAVLAAPVYGQGDEADGTVLRGHSDRTYKRLAEAERKLLAGKPADAAEDIRRVVDEAGDDLVSADGRRFRPARVVAQSIFVRLPTAVLRGYRDQVDGPARQLVDAGTKARDPRPLRTAVERYFVSRPAEQALFLLGELAFERGEFRTAEGYWRRLLPNPDPAGDPSYPDPKIDPAAVRARVVLSAVFLGELDRARTELAALRAEYPQATGRLAGKDGPLVDTLQTLLDGPPVVVAEPVSGGGWTGFAGGPARDSRVSGRLPYYWPHRPTWSVPFPRDDTKPRVFPGISPASAVAFHPVVLDGVAYVADPVRVYGFDVKTGQPQFFYDLRGDTDAGRLLALRVSMPPRDVADYTLTAANGRLYARLGWPDIAPVSTTAGPRSWLVGLAPPAGPQPNAALEVRWKLPPPTPADTSATWEAAPVAAEGRLYAAFARGDGTRVVHAVACFTDPPSEVPIWVAELCDAGAPTAPRYRPEPLTLAGGNLVYCSHTGVAVALDIHTGRPTWAFRYPRANRPLPSATHDVCPAVSADGRVFLAPADADHVFALDAETGRQIWQSEPVQVDQLLGVARGRLIVTVAGPQRGIRGLDVVTGSDREPLGWRTHDDPRLKSFGRGLLSDDLVVWPTQEAVYFLSPSDGLPVRPPIRRPLGNLAFAEGVVLAATPTELWGYVPDTEPTSLDTPRARAEWFADQAEVAMKSGDHDTARRQWIQSLGDAVPISWRARAAGRLLSLEPTGGGAAAQARFFSSLPQASSLEAEWVSGPNGIPVRLGHLAGRHFGTPRSSLPSAPSRPAIRRYPSVSDEDTLHSLGQDVSVDRMQRLPGIPLHPFADPAGGIFTSDGSHVYAMRPDAHAPAWVAPLPGELAVTHVALIGDSVLSAGPRGVVRHRLTDGEREWFFRLPDADPIPSRGPQTVPRTPIPNAFPTLSAFTLAGSRLVARVGAHHLIGLDLATGDVSWMLDGRGQNHFTQFSLDTDPRFSEALYADDSHVIVQLSNGLRWTIEAESGRVNAVVRTSLVEWSGPPISVGPNRVAVADGPGLVRVMDPTRNREWWSVDLGSPTSLTGRPPQFRVVRGGLVVATFRNHGVEVERIAPGGGRVWRGVPALLPAGDIDLSASDSDGVHLFVPAEGRVHALRLSDGEEAWGADLAAITEIRSGWQVQAGRKIVIAYPTEAAPEEPVSTVARRMMSSLVWPWRLPGLTAGLYDAWAARTAPILALNAETGRIVGRLDLRARGPTVVADIGPERAVIATAGALYRIK